MLGVAVRPVFYAPVVANYRYRLPARDHVDVRTSLSFPLKKMFPSLMIKARPLRVAAFLDSSENKKPEDFLLHNLPLSPLKRDLHLPRASKDKLFSFPQFPPMEEKPIWWLRSLACMPYLMNFLDQLTWVHAYPTSNAPPFIEHFKNFFFPLHSSLMALPKFFLSCYPIIFYYFLVRRKEWPHFFRFHVMNAVLLGCLVQVIGVSSGWFPKMLFPPHFWSAATLLFLITVLECMRCALVGEYPSIPFVKTAALLHSDLKMR